MVRIPTCRKCGMYLVHCDCGDKGGTLDSTAFRSTPQRNDPSVTNSYFNAGARDGKNHGHVKYRDNTDGTTEYLYARDVEGNEYDV